MSRHVSMCIVVFAAFVVVLGACVSHPESHARSRDLTDGAENADARLEMRYPGLPLKSLVQEVNGCASGQLVIKNQDVEAVRLGGIVHVCDSTTLALALQFLGLPVFETARAPLADQGSRTRVDNAPQQPSLQ
jgi:hypothetical protein